jgi:hypothetical protein
MCSDGNFPSLLSDAYSEKNYVSKYVLIKNIHEMLEFKSVCDSTLVYIFGNT